MTTTTNVALSPLVKMLSEDLVLENGRVRMEEAKWTSWRAKLDGAPVVMRPQIATHLTGLALKLVRLGPGAEDAANRVLALARRMGSGAGDAVGIEAAPARGPAVAPRFGAAAPQGTFKAGLLQRPMMPRVAAR